MTPCIFTCTCLPWGLAAGSSIRRVTSRRTLATWVLCRLAGHDRRRLTSHPALIFQTPAAGSSRPARAGPQQWGPGQPTPWPGRHGWPGRHQPAAALPLLRPARQRVRADDGGHGQAQLVAQRGQGGPLPVLVGGQRAASRLVGPCRWAARPMQWSTRRILCWASRQMQWSTKCTLCWASDQSIGAPSAPPARYAATWGNTLENPLAPAICLHAVEPAEGQASALRLGAGGSTGGCHACQGDRLCHFW